STSATVLASDSGVTPGPKLIRLTPNFIRDGRAPTWPPRPPNPVSAPVEPGRSRNPSDALSRLGVLRGGGVGLPEVLLGEAVEGGATFEDVGGDLARHVLEQVLRHVREVRIEVRIVRRDAHPVGADEPGCRLDLRLAALDRGPAVAPEVLARGHGQVRRV